MDEDLELTGIHHLTAVSAQIRDNHRFYTKTMGMRLVKRSVNQDDVSAYHLFYSDAKGTPGSDITFFDRPVPRERRGTHAITRTHLRVAGLDALEWWKESLRDRGVATGQIVERDLRLTLDFEDSEGQRLSFLDDQGAGEAHPWERSPVPAEHQVRGLGPIMLSVPDLRPTDALLRQALNMRPVREYQHPENPKHTVHAYEMGPGRALGPRPPDGGQWRPETIRLVRWPRTRGHRRLLRVARLPSRSSLRHDGSVHGVLERAADCTWLPRTHRTRTHALVMIVAAGSVHWQNGVFATANGIEVPLLYAVGAFALGLTGPGRYSLDALLGLDAVWTPALKWGILAIGIIGGLANLGLRRAATDALLR